MPTTSNSSPNRPSSRLSAPELDVLSELLPTLQQEPEPLAARAVLRRASQRGLDPRRIWDVALRVRSQDWPLAPSWEEVSPSRSAPPTTPPSASNGRDGEE